MALRSRLATAACLLFMISVLGGCASTPQVDTGNTRMSRFITDKWPTWAGGEPADTPARPASTPYPNVFDEPTARRSPAMSVEQQTQAATDLNRVRNRVFDQIRAAKAFDDENTAAALTDATKGQVAGDIAEPANWR
jgi:hypothetical protein